MDNPRLDYLREKVRQLPKEPGVYIMRDKTGKIIYIGKAKALRNRVSSYFRSVEKHLEKVYKMVENVYDFETIVTDSEFEALVLECSLIKQYTPKYNILLKDDKGYSYIRVTPPPFSRIQAVLQKQEDDGCTYLGPYMSSYVVKQTVDEANRVFMLPTCNRKFPQEFRKGRPCLNFHIKQCIGLCRGRIGEKEYAARMEEALDFIRGGSAQALERLEKQMLRASGNLEFEKAAQYRDRIQAIKRITDRQKVVSSKAADADIVAFTQSDSATAAAVLLFRNHRLVDKKDFVFYESGDLPAFRREFLLSYYREDIPRIIEVDGDFEDRELTETYFSQKMGHKITIVVPQRGEQAKLVEMAHNNASQRLSHEVSRTGRELSALDELARLLGLPAPPAYLEAYDISNIGADTIVGGMVVFEGGRPQKKYYRKFKMKTQLTPDDYASMREMLARRFTRYKEEKGSEGFGRLPDLILLDGGKGHVAAIQPLLEEMGIEVPVFGMVKDDRHRTRAIAKDGGEIAISANKNAFSLVTRIQDEVHRYTIEFSRKSHRKSGIELAMTSVEGIGPARAKALFAAFKTQKAMRQATVEELAAVKGMTEPCARRLYDWLHADDME
ncbi:MAG: excinuclease ABC subunit UvrC [Oscillospiraceae bacterium]|nr:excinuclease ABC subunit UvrC [Oscillospiraceae bacterium]